MDFTSKCYLLLLLIIPTTFYVPINPLGCLAHNYIAEQTALLCKDSQPELYKIIQDNWNCYLVGSDYPDTGYMPGATYGELTHWQPFVDAYISYLHKAYPIPSSERNKRIAFLMGICTHIQADITSHWTYYDLVALYDFDNLPTPDAAWHKAHAYMDPASDFYVIVNKMIFNHPAFWWIPVGDLVAVYELMGHTISPTEIIRSNFIYYFAVGIDETVIALPAYLYDKNIAIPWG